MATQTKYTNDQIRSAILRAADRIEREPGCYSFGNVYAPVQGGGCGTEFCMLGWIGHELGSAQKLSHYVAAEILGMDVKRDYNIAANKIYDFIRASGFVDFQRSAKHAADGMRSVADKFFPASSTPDLDSAYLAFRAAFTGSMEAA